MSSEEEEEEEELAEPLTPPALTDPPCAASLAVALTFYMHEHEHEHEFRRERGKEYKGGRDRIKRLARAPIR